MTLTDNKKEFPDWDTYYKENNVEDMPWYEKTLDPDLENEIKSRKLSRGKSFSLILIHFKNKIPFFFKIRLI